MMALDQLALGLGTAGTPTNLAFCFAGVFLGTLIGVLPGIGPASAIALLLPFTFSLPPTSAVIMLAGIYYGSQYGGSITAILINLPGEAAATITCIDGHRLAQQGRAGLALGIAAVASFVGGTLGVCVIALLSTPLATLAGYFEAADYVGLLVCGLVASVVFTSGSIANALGMALVGLLLGSIGSDAVTQQPRLTFGIPHLLDGLGFVPLAIGLFGLTEAMAAITTGARPIDTLTPKRSRFEAGEVRRATHATMRGTWLGALFGVLPGGGPVLASFGAYAVERRLSRIAPRVGSGAVEGLAAPEAANNAAAQTSFIPLLTLGLPANPVMALFVGALIVHGIQPGPDVIQKQPALFWGLIASMWIGNIILLGLNLPLAGLWARVLQVPRRLLVPATVVLSCTGIYALNHGTFELAVAALFGAFGFVFRQLRCDAAPLLLGFILSRPLEENIQRALVFADSDAATFLTHPIAAGLLALSGLLLVFAITPQARRARGGLR